MDSAINAGSSHGDAFTKQMLGLGVFEGLGDWKMSEETYREQVPLILGILKVLDINPE